MDVILKRLDELERLIKSRGFLQKEPKKETKKETEDVVHQLKVLCEDMAVVKAYILALQKPLLDRCNTWIDGRMVAKMLRTSAKTVQRLRNDGTLPYSKIGGKFYYKVEDLEEMLRKHYSTGKIPGGGDE